MKKFIATAVTSALLAIGASSASALVFDFAGGGGDLGNGVMFNIGSGVIVTVSTPGSEVTQTGAGLGVLQNGADGPNRGLDADPFKESLDFSFSAPVTISSLTFGGFGGSDRYDIFRDLAFTSGSRVVNDGASGTASFSPELATSFFADPR